MFVSKKEMKALTFVFSLLFLFPFIIRAQEIIAFISGAIPNSRPTKIEENSSLPSKWYV
jgi:hypothetical protein